MLPSASRPPQTAAAASSRPQHQHVVRERASLSRSRRRRRDHTDLFRQRAEAATARSARLRILRRGMRVGYRPQCRIRRRGARLHETGVKRLFSVAASKRASPLRTPRRSPPDRRMKAQRRSGRSDVATPSRAVLGGVSSSATAGSVCNRPRSSRPHRAHAPAYRRRRRHAVAGEGTSGLQDLLKMRWPSAHRYPPASSRPLARACRPPHRNGQHHSTPGAAWPLRGRSLDPRIAARQQQSSGIGRAAVSSNRAPHGEEMRISTRAPPANTNLPFPFLIAFSARTIVAVRRGQSPGYSAYREARNRRPGPMAGKW